MLGAMMSFMRSTVRLDDDLVAELKARARSENTSFTKMLNRIVRMGLSTSRKDEPEPYVVTTVAMGPARVDLDKALALAADLEDEEILRKMSLKK
jgi:hypothetical protein